MPTGRAGVSRVRGQGISYILAQPRRFVKWKKQRKDEEKEATKQGKERTLLVMLAGCAVCP
ncbi:hypothetical protein D1841_08280 [Neglecta sp. X4]|nr:hypothetical protein [Neglectibacter sp. 59]NBJ73305.1 hypothetical protein [Neglectibacter sp. X4]NCE81157.1 hypothetical protein [Neglectibacter sp. X58]